MNLGNFRKVWDGLDAETERVDDYGLGQREGLQEAVEAVIAILGMHPCEGTEAVPPNARSHTTLLSGMFVGYVQARSTHWLRPALSPPPLALRGSRRGGCGARKRYGSVWRGRRQAGCWGGGRQVSGAAEWRLRRAQVMVRLSFGIDATNNVAMKLAVRAEDAAVSDIVHQIISSA